MTPETEKSSNNRGWLEPVLWSAGLIVAIITAACLDETVREVTVQGLAYFFTFITTPFVLEATVAFIGLSLVLIINSRREAREGDGWVVMEVRKPEGAEQSAEENPSDKA